ncbi:MAG: amidophosphoribosyltransferase [Chlamydiae bacterium CG10_big_fil_rev_8_21_14_0_10_35_9]|nr:MAG: amidophosphoribosyltransferase [Chlamydiae bacterium CG10_big_fil_rev_8_21_14_0_10_35_9]
MCGILGIVSKQSVAKSLYHGLIQLQHRGQDASGIYLYDAKLQKEHLIKDTGYVHQVFDRNELENFSHNWGIGHVRYSTIGKGDKSEAQPFAASKIAVAHNGNIVNYIPLKRALTKKENFYTNSDAEVFQYYLNKRLEVNDDFASICTAIQEIYKNLHGAYSVVCIIKNKGIIAFRDPKGLRPLLYGRNGPFFHAFASESAPLNLYECETIYDLEPGEVMFIDQNFQVHKKILQQEKKTTCSFEFNYFAKPSSVIESKEIYRVRANLGIELGKQVLKKGLIPDVVISVPESGNPAAMALAHYLGLPIEAGLIKQNNANRTFILPTQKKRAEAAKKKWLSVNSVFKGKKVLLVDDSIVRGTVSKRAIELARLCGANEVYFASTYPPIKYPCFYGIDFNVKEQLISNNKTESEVARAIMADAVIFNDLSGLQKAIGTKDLCTACLDGNYPTQTDGKEELMSLREHDLALLETVYTG